MVGRPRMRVVDIAAGTLIVREAGGVSVTAFLVRSWRWGFR